MRLGQRIKISSGLALAALLVLGAVTAGAADRPFSPRFATNDTGAIAIAANTLLTCPTSENRCAAARAGAPLNNNVFTMIDVDSDDDPATVNSSEADLNMPADAEVLFAGLYWGSDSNATIARRSTVKFRVPGGAYQTIGPAGVAIDTSSGDSKRYQANADVTTLVDDAGPGAYWVADVATTANQKDRHGGWALVVAYRSATEPARNLTVFDGLQTVNTANPSKTIPVRGFLSPATGPVRTTLGFVAYEGDRGSDGDGATLDNQPLSDAANPRNNFFNSSISRQGNDISTKRPDYVNQLGFDAHLINANNFLASGATSAVIRVNTNPTDGEAYFPGVITFATELFAPRIEPTKSVENLDNPGGPNGPGDTLRYTLQFENTGGDGAENFTVGDTIPGGTTYVPGSLRIDGVMPDPTDPDGDDQAEFDAGSNRVTFWVGAGADGTVGGRIPPGGSATMSFDVTIDDLADGSEVTDRARFDYAAQTLGRPLGGETNETVTPVSAPDLAMSKSHSPPGDFIAGSGATYELEVRNVGSVATDGSTVKVTDILPADAFASITTVGGPGWTCPAPVALAITCTRSDSLGPGDFYPPITITALLLDPLTDGVANTAEVSGGGDTNDNNNAATDQANGAARADLAITKLVDPATVPSGSDVSYTITVTNRGPSAAQGVTVDDPVDSNDFSDVDVATTKGTCDTTVSCNIGSLASGATATITVTAKVAANETTILNTATVTSTGPEDPDPDNDSAGAELIVPNTADLGLVKTDDPADPDHPTAGGTYTYTLTIDNNGPGVASNVLVEDPLPDLFTPSSIVAPGWDCNSPGAGEELTCTRSSLAPADGPVAIKITGQLAQLSEATTILNSAHVRSDDVDPDPGRAQDEVSNLVLAAADLDLSKSGPGVVQAGKVARFILRLENLGPGVSAGARVNDKMPAGLRLISVDSGACSVRGQTIDCDFGDLAPGAVRSITVRARASKSADGQRFANIATATATTPDPIPSSNEGSAAVRVVGGKPKLSVHKSASLARARPGQVFGYAITVRNRGDAAATGVHVCDRLPRGLHLLRAKGAPRGGGRACWTLKRLGDGTSKTFRLVVQLALHPKLGPVKNVAHVDAANARPAEDAARIRIVPPPSGPCPSRGAGSPAKRC